MAEPSPARSKILIENDKVRVTEWSFESGAATGFHRHALDYVVVPVADGTLTLVDSEGVRRHAELRIAEPYYRDAGVEHDVLYEGPGSFRFIEVELKRP